MVIVDIISLLVLTIFIVFGYKHRLLLKFVWVFSIAFGFFAGLIFGPMIREFLWPAKQTALAEIAAFLILFITGFVLALVSGRGVTKKIDESSLKVFDGILGALWGMVKFLIIISIIFFILNLVLPENVKIELYKTYTGRGLVEIYSFINLFGT